MNNNNTCQSVKYNNTFITNVYEGIPQTLILNFVVFWTLVIFFGVLRNRAWDYGRLALVQNEKWTQLFYKSTDEALAVEETSADTSLAADNGCRWLPNIFRINKNKLFERCGPDAANYLSFQRHLIVLMAVITLFSMCVILPVNFQGDLQGDVYSFGHTTISNLAPGDDLLWIHVIASFCFVPITILIMRRCSSRIPSVTLISSRTVMITHISHAHRNPDEIRNYLAVRYPNIEIKEIQFAYKIKNLMKVEKERLNAHEAKMYCINKQKFDLLVQPYGCIICCPYKTENALQFYSSEEERLTNLVVAERNKAFDHPLGIAFVTVNSEEAARYMIDSFQPGILRSWNITKAPSPSDINWENLEISTRHWYFKAIAINIILFLVLFFLTTPAIIVNLFFTYTSAQEKIVKLSPIVSEFLPILLLLTMAALLPVIVAYSDQWMSYWTKSKQNNATMHKTFFLLLFMVLILPSLGLTSLEGLLLSSAKNITVQRECIFLADKGAFFVNYVITSAFIGTALELLRFPELAMYLWRLLLIKSEAEKVSVRKEILSVFPFGVHYTWTLLIFTLSTTYSLTCPLITPFALLYLCLKHLVDKHNIYYVYRPIIMIGESAQIHARAVRMVRVSIVLLQLVLAAFSTLRGGITDAKTDIIFIGLFATISCFFFVSPFPTCNPKQTNTPKYQDTGEQYVAPVLVSAQNLPDHVENVVVAQPDYGSSSINEFGARLMASTGSSIA